jgi:adenylate kinase family enzyme
VQRVLVVGQSGSGKTTLARALAARLGVAHVELDAVFHGPGWQSSPTFVADVDAATTGPSWVADGNYSAVRDLLWTRADTVVWLDLPRTATTRRALARTLRRVVLRTELWNGNREQLRNVLRGSHPIRWSWQTHRRHRGEYDARAKDPRWQDVAIVRLRTPAEVRSWLARQGS